MRLIELTSNRTTFKTVKFNRTGVSLVIGSRKDQLHGEDDSRSYNGVGKSLLIEIIHFCLGSSTNTSFRQHLPSWEFTLRFEIGQTAYSSSRSTDKQGTISLNGQILKVKAFNELLGKLCFHFPDWGGSQLSFRSLLPRFIRRSKADYNDPKITSSDREPYTVLLRNLFLLGIDISLVENKYSLRTRQSELELFERNFKNDPFIREYYTGSKDASLQAKHLEEQIARFESDLAQFAVAEDYYQIEKEANDLTGRLRALKNKRAVVENALSNVQKSLEARADIPREKVLAMYGELQRAFRDETLKHLQEVEAFHSQLLTNRIARLGQERMRLETEKRNLELEIHQLNQSVDAKLRYLSDKRALDQYAAVSAQLSDLRAKFHKLQDYQHLLHKSREDAASIRIKLAEENIKTNAYLDETFYETESRLNVFSSLAKRFYPDAPAGITLQNNIGDNKTRYDFDVRIGGLLDKPLSRSNANGRPSARYFVLHDTSDNVCANIKRLASADLPTAPWNRVERWKDYKQAHMFITRDGKTVRPQERDFSVPWRATRLENKVVGERSKGIFLHVESVQVRSVELKPGQSPLNDKGKCINDRISQYPGFTDAQYDRLALAYINASVRAGEWLVPAFHVAIDRNIGGGHDDPRNFDLSRWGTFICHRLVAIGDSCS
ncbi:conserved hypothetical protein, COG5293 [Cupriavidus taiwanensis]|uniref:DUF2326 domain-containing protein n=1 Tax=Cupriavidus taiwanensis TaxID=164546 RepID=A0A375CN97_9BURK|nr:conserved hypothetical protein, COG5293 [Cupriavidus taiwanensis]